MTPSTMQQPIGGPATEVAQFVVKKIQRLQSGLVDQQASWAKADAARLRRAVSRPAGSVPEVWEVTLGGLPENLTTGNGDEPTASETAVHNALCFYALHQQSKSQRMHQAGQGLGRALQDLHRKSGAPDLEGGPLMRRLNALSTADSLDEMLWHLRGLIAQLRAEGIALDYGLLARDLYRFSWPSSRDSVRRQWGRDFYGYRPEVSDTAGVSEGADTSVTDN